MGRCRDGRAVVLVKCPPAADSGGVMQRESSPEPGTELGGRYRLEERIGAGGMGEVWRGGDQPLRRLVAIKILPVAADRTATERFRREAETSAALQHPGITVMLDL